MINRLFTLPMSAENKLIELKKIKLITKTNGYFSEIFVDRIHKKKHFKKDNFRQPYDIY
jgi:hypothetical protein